MTVRGWAIFAGVVVAAGVVGYGFGRYATPAKVEVRTETKTQTVVEYRDRVVERVVQGPTRTVTVAKVVTLEVPCPPGGTAPGTESTTTTTVEAGPVVIDRTSDGSGTATASSQSGTSTRTTQEAPRWLLQAGAGLDRHADTYWTAGASYRLAGPFWLGAAYQSTKAVEIRVGFSL